MPIHMINTHLWGNIYTIFASLISAASSAFQSSFVHYSLTFRFVLGTLYLDCCFVHVLLIDSFLPYHNNPLNLFHMEFFHPW